MKRYFKHKLENLIVVNKIVMLYYFEFNKNYKHEKESHDFWEIVYAKKSDLVCTADGKEIILKEGEMLFHKPNETHSLSTDGVSAPDVFVILFECRSKAMRFFENKVIPLQKKQINLLYSLIEEAGRTFDTSDPDPERKKMEFVAQPTLGGGQIIKNTLEILLIDLMRNLTESEQGNKTFLSEPELDDKLVSSVIETLKNGVYSRLNVDDVCRKTSYSRSYVFRKFKSVTGKTVMEYFNALKIIEAKKLLRADLSIKEISENLCFDTPNYFSKSFKKAVGLTPTAYKKKALRIK